ncbi:YbgC/FadM family acyl-CoA thioesterase [Legionella dresdenensis]|uniref:YbgC/FadM family acyl-CoA thioesterase n=1 Tax=Legionella dresdenensis TaxID=450200 RepID=A0ABV8CGZ2_9GAMM
MSNSTMANELFAQKYRVYAEDTDFMGIVYHARYLNFFERARSDALRQHGISLTRLASCDYHLAITEVNLDYRHPARLEDEILITTWMNQVRSCSIVFKQKMENQDNRLLCEATIKVVCIDSAMKPKRLPKQFV